MDIYLTSKESGERLRIPLLPNKLDIRTGANTVPFNIIKTGEVKIPRGTILTGYSWSGEFPGESKSGLSFIVEWQEPNRIIQLLEEWENSGETLNLLVTETVINADVFIESFNYWYFGYDSVGYSITLTIRRELTISTAAARTEETPAATEEKKAETKKKEKKKKKTKKSAYTNTKSTTSSKSLIYNPPSSKLLIKVKASVKKPVQSGGMAKGVNQNAAR